LKKLSKSHAAHLVQLEPVQKDRDRIAKALELASEQLKSAADEHGRLQEQLTELADAEMEEHILNAIVELERLEAELESKRLKAPAASSDASEDKTAPPKQGKKEKKENGAKPKLIDSLKEVEAREVILRGKILQSKIEEELEKKTKMLNEHISAAAENASKAPGAAKLKELVEEKGTIEARHKQDLDILTRKIQEVEDQLRNMPSCFISFFRELWERNGPKDIGQASILFSNILAFRKWSGSAKSDEQIAKAWPTPT
jgi:hypothetical protein